MGAAPQVARVAITEYLEVDLATERWHCRRCGHDIGDARRPYKEGCLAWARDPATLFPPHIEGSRYSFAPDAALCMVVEFYCPGCGTLVETEALPPGHPPTVDLELDIDSLRARHGAGDAK